MPKGACDGGDEDYMIIQSRSTDGDTGKTKISWTYDVRFEASEIRWASRWDIYLKMGDMNNTKQIHWFSIVNSLLVTFLLSGMTAIIMVRSLRKDFRNYNRVLTDEEKQEE